MPHIRKPRKTIKLEWEDRVVRCTACVLKPVKEGNYCFSGRSYTANQQRCCEVFVQKPDGVTDQAMALWKRLGRQAHLLKDLRLDRDGIAVRFHSNTPQDQREQVKARLLEELALAAGQRGNAA